MATYPRGRPCGMGPSPHSSVQSPILPLGIYYQLLLGLCNPSPDTFQT